MAAPSTSESASSAAVEPLGRRERRKLELRLRIVEAARSLFEEQGFDGATISEIAARADVADKTFFNHFPTKQHLVRELAYRALDNLVEGLDETRKENASTQERLLHFFRQVATSAEQGGRMQRQLVTETIHALHDARDESQQVQRIHDAFVALVEDGRQRDELPREHDSETLTNVILGAFYSLMFNWAHVDDYPIRAQAEATARFLASALEAEDRSSLPA